MHKTIILSSLLLGCICLQAQTQTQATDKVESIPKTASLADFEELQKRFEGRWMGELEVKVLWPKIGLQKGDVAEVYADFDIDLDGMTLIGERKLGHIKWKQTFHFDAVNSTIVANCAGSNGFWSQETWWKVTENVYGSSFSGGQRDGSTFSGAVTWTFSKDGQTVVAASHDIKQSGSDSVKDRVFWKKISP